ncbi:hypothetical protein NLX83_23400 [Allokutzneria sp. A3M-2-11 16]|uniref:hypothetical protein n=1 Tax=Allokutzneria sp. A3M-2-11 16 TaxID=2962043 RepID=UPI0020B83835|nr:hypothetical protein [Allokutzneria sp. A3M-2-11 16]MCP3802219.1 hypothetical protein [Allokutzneria sp. A3M-2-11 16]
MNTSDRHPGPGNNVLRALLDEAGMSNIELAGAVVAAGAEEGVHLGTSATTVRRMLDGSQPRRPVPRLVAEVLSRQLGREVSVADCGFAERGSESADTYEPLDGAMRTVIELSGDDVGLRAALLGSVPGRRIGMADVDGLTENIARLRGLDRRFGSSSVREPVIQLFRRGWNAVAHGTYSERTGRALLSAVAQACWLAGSATADAGRHVEARRYSMQTLTLAMAAGDRLYAAHVLSHLSRVTAQHKVSLARAGRNMLGRNDTPTLAALLHAVEARGHAQLGDHSAMRESMREAERHFARQAEEPAWLSHYTEAELAADLGRCLRDTGDPEQGLRMISRVVDEYEPWRVRSRCYVRTDLALTHLARDDHEQAASLGEQAISIATTMKSDRMVRRLRVLHDAVRPLTSRSRPLGDLDDRLVAFLAS